MDYKRKSTVKTGRSAAYQSTFNEDDIFFDMNKRSFGLSSFDEDRPSGSCRACDSPTSLDKALHKSAVNLKRPMQLHEFLHVVCTDCGHKIDIPITCGDPFCVVCAKWKQRKYRNYIRQKIGGMVDRGQKLRMMTLTIKNTNDLAAGYDKLREDFTRLRRRNIWTRNVKAAVAGFEVTNSGSGWHVHVHIFYDGRFIRQQDLSRVWLSVTGDSKIVDIRAIHDVHGALKEVMKYPFKPADARNWSDRERGEYCSVMAGKRRYTTYGAWYGEKLVEPRKKGCCPDCGGEMTIMDFLGPMANDVEIRLEQLAGEG